MNRLLVRKGVGLIEISRELIGGGGFELWKGGGGVG